MKLEDIKIATPCSVPWESMSPVASSPDRVRHCAHCNQNVYNIARMTRVEAEAFLEKAAGSTCVQLWRRDDGTIATSDCGRVVLPAENQTGGLVMTPPGKRPPPPPDLRPPPPTPPRPVSSPPPPPPVPPRPMPK